MNLSVKQAAALLSVSEKTISPWIQLLSIPAYRSIVLILCGFNSPLHAAALFAPNCWSGEHPGEWAWYRKRSTNRKSRPGSCQSCPNPRRWKVSFIV